MEMRHHFAKFVANFPGRIGGAVTLLALYALCAAIHPAWAQTQDELILYVRRNIGYSGGSQIQGSFRMEAVGPAHLASVTFKIDEAVVGTLTEPPFRINFDTDDYPLGWHVLSAVGQTADGQTLTSETKRFEFVSAEAGFAAVRQIVIPILGVVGVVLLLAMGIPLAQTLAGRKSALPLGAPRRYGLLGGTICPKCGRPYSIHWWSFNAVGAKFDRCDHCGRWSRIRRVSRDKLAQAEAAEAQMAQPETPLPQMSADERLRREVDESRFLDT